MVAASPSPSAAPPATDSASPSAASPSASPPATAATASGRPHPSYTKMITQALTELGGTSGRAAIAGFILGRFTGLPAAHDHDALLSAHLRRLAAEGVVRGYGSKSRACYVFPASDTRGRGRPRDAATRLPKNHLNLDHDDDSQTIWPAPFPLATCVNPDWDPNSASNQNSVPNLDLDGFQSNTSDDDVAYNGEHEHDDEYTPRPVPAAKRGRGRPPKIKRGRGRPRKEEQQSQQATKHPPTPTASSRWGFKLGCGRPMLAPTTGHDAEAGDAMPAETGSAASAGIKRPRGRPRKEKPAAAMSAQAGDAASAGIKRGRGRPSKEKPDSASAGIKRGRGRPRKEKPDSASAGIKRGRGRPRKYNPAAAVSAEDGDAVSAGMA
ncbi:origin recognition complex subunit 4-like [Triticum dicoccoides]|uniref:H15 domain-containing protein n=1 Tax=Triticum aestivum TaxID=4565 RepID=A0A3B5Z5Y9_WHEAT|nr:origin recognition complex subunit 4-like [Triticum dicoccoides]XP_044426016.1 origin recognition complex subunit 4-like [Triticum aestivum]